MKPVSNLLHNTPWWLLLSVGFALLVGLAIFATPLALMNLDHRGQTPEERRAIKSEIDTAFSESALDIGRSVLKEMRNRTKDPKRREELDRALEEVEAARSDLREAGVEVLRAKRQAAEDVANAVKEAHRSIAEAQHEAARALKDAGVENEKVQKSLEESLKATEEAQKQVQSATAKGAEEKGAAPKAPDAPSPPRIPHISVDVDLNPSPAPSPPSVRLPPELRDEIHKSVSGGLYRMGVGAGLILIFVPLFALTIVSKFFIDRSRAAQALAESKKREAEFHRMSQQVTEAKLSALQAQVEPHFLYNTLASVQALTEVDPQQANAMTGHLIQYLRNALPKMRGSASTVGQEIELVRAYLNILQMRMGKRLAFEIDVPAELLDAPFPPLMLPSLVENAIKHGLEPQREGGTVRISASVAGSALRVAVTDTGKGFGDSLGSGVGLTNIRERLAALYGDAGKLTLEANEPQGVVATLEVPRDGVRSASAVAAGFGAAEPVMPPPPQGAAARTLAAMGSAERVWRKGLSFAFIVLVVVAAVIAGLGVVGVSTGVVPVQIGEEIVDGPTGALIGTAGIAVAFAAVVLALAIVLAVVYGLGFLMVGIVIFVAVVLIVSMAPVLAPVILVGLGIWWLVRRNNAGSKASPPAP